MTGSWADPSGFARRVEEVRDRVAAASADPDAVRIVAVTKGFGPEAARAALDAGLVELGENYADELVTKARIIGDQGGSTPVWHFLGAVQRNKVARLAPVTTWWQGVDRLEEGTTIVRRRPDAAVLVQVDPVGLPGRGGCAPDRVAGLVASLEDAGVRVGGLMAVGPPGPPAAARPAFATVSRLADRLDLPVRSIGMSDDFEVALSEGSTMVRIGRALFGSRPPIR